MITDTRQQAKDAICAIIAAAGGELHKKVALFKAFYYAHLYYWQDHQEALTDYPIVRMPQGPGIDDHAALLAELEQEGRIKISRESYGPFREFVYSLNEKYTIDPNDPQYQSIEKAVKWIEGKSAKALSDETHDYSRSWQQSANGDELNIYIDLMDDEEYVDMQRRLHDAEAMVNDVFSEVH